MSFKPPEVGWSVTAALVGSTVTADKSSFFHFQGWREVRSSADADLQLLKYLADGELENFLNSAAKSPFSVPTITASASFNPAPPAEIEFVKKLQPKLSEFQIPRIKINLSAIKHAIVAEEGDEENERETLRKAREETQFGDFWEPIHKDVEVEVEGIGAKELQRDSVGD